MKIFLVNGDQAGREFEFSLPELAVGWEADNDLILSGDGVSAHHARLLRDAGGRWLVRDLDSTNGTLLNRRPVSGEAELTEGDVLEFGGRMVRVTGLTAAAPVKVVLTPLAEPAGVPVPAAAAAGPEPEGAAPAGVPASSPADPGAALSEALKSGGRLFGGRRPAAAAGAPRRRIFSNRLFYVVLVCGVIIAVSGFYQLTQLRRPKPAAAERGVPVEDFLLYYEKEQAGADNLFRFVLHIENGAAEFVIDDLKSQRRFRRRIDGVNEASLESFRASIERSGFLSRPTQRIGQELGPTGEYRRLTVGDGGKLVTAEVVNDIAPKAFEDIEYAINSFAENYGLQTIAMTPEELRDQAEQSFVKAEELYANREARLSNLRDAIRRYAVTVTYLDQFSPKPKMWDVARKRLEEAEALRTRKIRELIYERIRLANLQEFERVRYVLNQMMELCDADSKEYTEARRQLFRLDRFLNQGGGRK